MPSSTVTTDNKGRVLTAYLKLCHRKRSVPPLLMLLGGCTQSTTVVTIYEQTQDKRSRVWTSGAWTQGSLLYKNGMRSQVNSNNKNVFNSKESLTTNRKRYCISVCTTKFTFLEIIYLINTKCEVLCFYCCISSHKNYQVAKNQSSTVLTLSLQSCTAENQNLVFRKNLTGIAQIYN